MRFSGTFLNCLQVLVIAVTTQFCKGDGEPPMSIIGFMKIFMTFINALTCCAVMWILRKYYIIEITFPGMLMEGLEVVVAVIVTTQLFTDGLLVYNWTHGGSLTALVFMKICLIFVAPFIFYCISFVLKKYYRSKIMGFPEFLLKCIQVLLNVAVTTQLCVEGVLLLLLYRGRPTQHFIEGGVLLIFNIGGPSIMGLVFMKIALIFVIAFMSYSIFFIQRKYYILKTQTDIQVSSCRLSMVVVFINFMGALMNDFSSSI